MLVVHAATGLLLAPYAVGLILLALWIARLPPWQEVLADSTLASHPSDPGET